MLKAIKPYRGGNEALRAIHELDVRDKHKVLMIANSAREIKFSGYVNAEELAQHAFTVNDYQLEFAIPEGVPFEGTNVISTLEHFLEVTEGVVEQFARLCAV